MIDYIENILKQKKVIKTESDNDSDSIIPMEVELVQSQKSNNINNKKLYDNYLLNKSSNELEAALGKLSEREYLKYS